MLRIFLLIAVFGIPLGSGATDLRSGGQGQDSCVEAYSGLIADATTFLQPVPPEVGISQALTVVRAHSKPLSAPPSTEDWSPTSHAPTLSDLQRKEAIRAGLEQLGYDRVTPLGEGGMSVLLRASRGDTESAIKIFNSEWEALIHPEQEAHIMNLLSQVDSRFHSADPVSWKDPSGIVFRGLRMPVITKTPESQEVAPTLETLAKSIDFWKQHPHARAQIQDQLMELLGKAHSVGIAHLDVKPGNILIQLDAQNRPIVHIIDWGFAHQAPEHGPHQQGLVARGSLFGTPGYIPQRRFLGTPPGPKDDLYALRIVDWMIRNAEQGYQGVFAVRSFSPGANPPAPKGSSRVLPADSSGFVNSFKEPAHGLDSAGTLPERILAMAEWSELPTTIQQRQDLFARARTLPPEEFLRWYGQELSKIDEPFGQVEAGTRPTLTLEVLGSSLLIDQIHPKRGLHLSTQDIDAIARTAAKLHAESSNKRMKLGLVGPHSGYFYDRLKKKVDELAEEGVTQPWSYWEGLAQQP